MAKINILYLKFAEFLRLNFTLRVFDNLHLEQT